MRSFYQISLFIFIISFIFTGCSGFSSNAEEDLQADTPYQYYTNLDDAQALIDVTTADLPEAITDSYLSIITLKITSDHKIAPALGTVPLASSARKATLLKKYKAKTPSYSSGYNSDTFDNIGDFYKASDGIFFGKYIEAKDDNFCMLAKYNAKDDLDCFFDYTNSELNNELHYIALDNDQNIYFFLTDTQSDTDIFYKGVPTGPNSTITKIADFTKNAVQSIRVDSSGNALFLFNDDVNDTYNNDQLYFAFSDGSLYDVTTALSLRATDITLINNTTFYIIGTNTNSSESGLFKLILDASAHTLTQNLITSTVDNTKIDKCNFAPNLSQTITIECDTGTIINILDNPLFISHAPFIKNIDHPNFVKKEFEYMLVDETLEESQPNNPLKKLIKLDTTNGDTETLWNSENTDLISIDSFTVGDDAYIYFDGSCITGYTPTTIGGGGDPIIEACIGYLDKENQNKAIILLHSDPDSTNLGSFLLF